MPLYAYWCANCLKEIELIRPWDAPNDITCPKCNAIMERERFGATRWIAKTYGFYKTDSVALPKQKLQPKGLSDK